MDVLKPIMRPQKLYFFFLFFFYFLNFVNCFSWYLLNWSQLIKINIIDFSVKTNSDTHALTRTYAGITHCRDEINLFLCKNVIDINSFAKTGKFTSIESI